MAIRYVTQVHAETEQYHRNADANTIKIYKV